MSEQTQEPVFQIEKMYVKDLSIEVPNAPEIFLEREAPQVDVEMSTQARQVEEGIYEVLLNVSVSSRIGEDKTQFLVEVAQGGVFQIRNIPADDMEPVLMIGCANILVPFAREVVADATTRAGFQPVLLAPVNFEAIYASQRQSA